MSTTFSSALTWEALRPSNIKNSGLILSGSKDQVPKYLFTMLVQNVDRIRPECALHLGASKFHPLVASAPLMLRLSTIFCSPVIAARKLEHVTLSP
ncbi:hypothetical protein DY000_02004016 [Brassica cretica]|uniref:Uncharacterized protein n=1 Tax=Brassica cretica TaxID=69181 RepID=A0ABQ7CD85_BRACR|nr:hypothetical protein DY000_02004016 [Brassica cretica]